MVLAAPLAGHGLALTGAAVTGPGSARRRHSQWGRKRDSRFTRPGNDNARRLQGRAHLDRAHTIEPSARLALPIFDGIEVEPCHAG